jgi:cytochrome c oxidase subunit IV
MKNGDAMNQEQQSKVPHQRHKKRLLLLGRATLFVGPALGSVGVTAIFIVGRLTQSLLSVVMVAGLIITLIVASPIVGLILMEASGLWPAKESE